jgi:ABC-type transport system involved in multi-copper enzyme maturation permease subunit
VFQGEIEQLYISNMGDTPARVTGTFDSDVAMPEVHHIPIVATSVVGLFLLYWFIHNLLPGIGNIATATAKEAIGQPLYSLLIGIGIVACVAFIYIPYNTFGEDVKMLKDSGLTTIMVLGIIFALWTSSTSIADEIDGKTALTLLSKPISRRQFILGKFLGIIWPLALLFIVLGVVLLVVVSYKGVYDARETSNPTPAWQYCYELMIGTVPGLVLYFLEAVVLTAISVAISTRLSMLPNLIICGSIYVVGNLVPQIVNAAAAEKLPFVQFTGNFIASVLPMLHVFNIGPAIAGGKAVPFEYLGFALLYAVVYSTAAMLLALVFFEDRDLA